VGFQPSLELGGVEQPVARIFDSGAYILLTEVDLAKAESAEAGCEVSDFWT
jgi:hypothetical protein